MFHRAAGVATPPMALFLSFATTSTRSTPAHADTTSTATSTSTSTSKPIATLYLIRHAESTWNAAFARKNQNWPEWLSYSLDPVPILTDKDHPLTKEGAAQCLALRQRIAEAASEDGDADARAMLDPASALLTSSPLTRSIATAALTFPSAEKVLLLPAARESDAHWFYGRDSIGTHRSRIPARVDGVLRSALGRGAGEGAATTPTPVLDMSAMGEGEVWWSEGEEDEAAMAARLRKLLGDVAHHAAAARTTTTTSTTNAVVLTTHSLIIRRLFKAMLAEESKGAGQLGEALGSQSIVNCGVVAVDLVKADGDNSIRMARPRMLFGTNFASFSPTI